MRKKNQINPKFEKLFFNKGILLDTEEQKDGYKSKEEVNVKMIPEIEKNRVKSFKILLTFDYDIYTLLECVIDQKAFKYLLKESGWKITMEDLIIELQTLFLESQQKNPPTTIRYLITPLTSYMYFTQHTKNQSLEVFTLVFHDAEPEDSYRNGQIRVNDIKKDIEDIEMRKIETMKYLKKINPVLFEDIEAEMKEEEEN